MPNYQRCMSETSSGAAASSSASPHGWRSLVKLLGSVTAVQALGFILLPLLGRFYTKEEYGFLGTLMAIVGITTLLANGRYDQAAFVAPTGGRQRLLRVLGTGINLTLTTVLVVLCLLAPSWMQGTDYERFTPYLFIVPLTTFTSGLCTMLCAGANARGRYNVLSISALLQGYINNGLKVLCGWLSMGVWGFAVAFNTGLVTAVMMLLATDRTRWLRSVTWRRLRVVAHHYRSFPMYTIGQGIVAMLISSILLIMLPAYYEVADMGLITMLFTITRRPVQVYSDAVSRVYARRMVEAHAEGRSFTSQMNVLITRGVGLAVVGLLILPWFITPLVTQVIGEQWTALGGIIIWMIPFLAMEGLNFVFDFVPDVTRRQRAFLAVQGTRLVCEVLFILLVAPRVEFGVFIRAYFCFAMVAYAAILGWFYYLSRRADARLVRPA